MQIIWSQQWHMCPASSLPLPMICVMHWMWERFFRSFANHFAEREVDEDDVSEFFRLQSTASSENQWSQLCSQWYSPLSGHTSLLRKRNGTLTWICSRTKKADERICAVLWSSYCRWCSGIRRKHLEMDGTAIPMGNGRRMQITYVELWKKIAVSHQH